MRYSQVRVILVVDMFRPLGGGVPGDVSGLPRSQLAILPGATHVTVVDCTGWLLSMVTAFLNAPSSKLTEDSLMHAGMFLWLGRRLLPTRMKRICVPFLSRLGAFTCLRIGEQLHFSGVTKGLSLVPRRTADIRSGRS